MNNITVIGNLTADPEIRFTTSGDPVVNFTIAQQYRKFNRQTNQWEDGGKNFYRCTAWRAQAENIANTFKKGTNVIIIGHLKTEEFKDSNNGEDRRSTNNIDVEECGPAMKYQTADVRKVARSEQNNSGGGFQQSGQNNGGGFGGGAPQNNNGGGFGGGAVQQNNGGGFQQPAQANNDGWGGGFGSDEPPF